MVTRTPWFWARTGLEPGASGVHRPCAKSLGSLTTVGHLAKASPDLSPHFQTQKRHFLTSFQQRKTKFSEAWRSSRRENGWK